MGNIIQSGKKLFLLAAMLLAGVSAFAQVNNPAKIDVNRDKKLDVADIVAIIQVKKTNEMLQSGEIKHYWYVGTTLPTNPSNPDENTGSNKWTPILNSIPDKINIHTFPLSRTDTIWYVAIPHSYGYLPDKEGYLFDKSQITIGGVSYDLFTTTYELSGIGNTFK